MIGHQTVSQQPDWRTVHRCNHNPLERGVIFGFVKKLALLFIPQALLSSTPPPLRLQLESPSGGIPRLVLQ